jgi:hypothetical protein
MTEPMDLGGTFTFLDSSTTVRRMGYGAMQLAGPGVFGPPRDVDGAMLCCERRLRLASITSIRAIIMVHI